VKEFDLVVIGAGPGGIAAAVEAAKTGLKTVVLDENAKPGGRIYSQHNDGFRLTDPKIMGSDFKKGRALLAEFHTYRDQINYQPDALVFGVFENNILAFQQGGKGHHLTFGKLVVATGAYDRPVAFPGWTLPGVLTVGGAQTFVKMQRILPGENILFAGTGPLQLVVANQILDAGGRIEAILEAGNIDNWFKLLSGFVGNLEMLFDGLHYIKGIQKAGVPILRKHIILEARGDRRVEEAVVAEVDKAWRPIVGTIRNFQVDTVCIGYGLVPSNEITKLAGCEHAYSPRIGGWVPVRKDNMETSVNGVYAVGDGAGIAGSALAVIEGRIAGMSLAKSLCRVSSDQAAKMKKPLIKSLRKIRRFRNVLDEISVPRPGLYELANDETLICRCEEIMLGDVKNAFNTGVTEINEVKRLTRIGMGRCQGRMCGPILQEVLAGLMGKPSADIGYLNQRPPTKLVSLGMAKSLPGEYEVSHTW
jgi:thioredoxin reductase